jgi:hypothetical protein
MEDETRGDSRNDRNVSNGSSIWKKTGGFILAVLAVFGTYYGYLGYKYSVSVSTKALDVVPISRLPIITPQIGKGLKFTVNGVSTASVYLSSIHIENSGGQVIDESDFYHLQPINVQLPVSCKIVSTSVLNIMPMSLSNRIHVVGYQNQIIISPTLLNSGDNFTVNVVTGNCIPSYKVSGTIKGISSIRSDYSVVTKNRSEGIDIVKKAFGSIIVGAILGGSLIIVARRFRLVKKSTIDDYGAMFMAVVTTSFLFFPTTLSTISSNYLQEIPQVCFKYLNSGGE